VRRVLVTGAAGFVGHTLVANLLANTNAHVVGLDRLDTSGTLHRLQDVLRHAPRVVASRYTQVWHDLKAPINSHVAARLGNPDVILHLAASSHVDRSIEAPAEFVLDNVLGTCHLLEYARAVGPEKVLYFSTDEVFGPAAPGTFFSEYAAYRSGNPYAATKAGAEELAVAFHNTYGLPIMITHTMNVIGRRQHPEKFVPTCVRRILGGQVVTVHADADCARAGSRHYIDAEDVSEAVLFLLENGEPGEKYNIVGEREMDNLELAQRIADVLGLELKYELVDFHSSRPGHDLRYALSGDLMRRMGWQPRLPIEERLREIVLWTQRHPEWLY
jgi:dTDP-glucose 4,6-dehydratase